MVSVVRRPEPTVPYTSKPSKEYAIPSCIPHPDRLHAFQGNTTTKRYLGLRQGQGGRAKRSGSHDENRYPDSAPS